MPKRIPGWSRPVEHHVLMECCDVSVVGGARGKGRYPTEIYLTILCITNCAPKYRIIKFALKFKICRMKVRQTRQGTGWQETDGTIFHSKLAMIHCKI